MIATDPFGQVDRGDPIPGSSLFRNYCRQCGDAIRVALRDRLDRHCQCQACRHPGHRPRRHRRSKRSKTR